MPRSSLASILLVLLAASVAAQRNVLVIVVDDLGVENVGVYGVGTNPPPTPHIDALAQGGVLFRNAWAESMCSPTRAALLTGRHPFRTGVQNVVPAGPDLDPREVTIAEHLKRWVPSYGTGMFGKWHLSDRSRGLRAPNDQGFDHFAGTFDGLPDYSNWTRLVDGVNAPNTNYATSQNVDDALAWIGTQPGPWLCLFTPISVHAPFHAPPAHLHTQQLAGLDPNTDPVPFHRAMVEALDNEVGRLLSGIGPALQNTLVILLGDNGTPPEVAVPPYAPNHLKGTPYEGGVRVPFVVSGPDVVQPGRTVDALVSVVDVFATIGEAANTIPVSLFVRSDSVGLMPYLRDPTQVPLRSTIYSELYQRDPATGRTCGYSAMRDDRYKLIRRSCTGSSIQEELYDLATDPLETVDLTRRAMTASELARLDALGNAIDELTSLVPSMTTYGSAGCVGSFGVPRIRGAGTPHVGGTYGVLLTNAPPQTLAVLVVGGSDRWWRGMALPFSFAGYGGGAGCELAASIEFLMPMQVGAFGTVGLTITTPNDPMLYGAFLRHQWLVFDPTANGLGLTTSAGLCVGLGR